MFHGQIPVRDSSGRPVVLVGHTIEGSSKGDAGGRKLRTILCRKGVCNPLIRVHKRNIVECELRAEGRAGRKAAERLGKRRLIEDTPSAAHGRPAVSARIICEADART